MPPLLEPRNFDVPDHYRPRPSPDLPLSSNEIRRLAHALFPLLHRHLRLPRPAGALFSSEDCLALPLLSDLQRTSPEHAAREAHLLSQLHRDGRRTAFPSADTALLALHALPAHELLADLQRLLDDQVSHAAPNSAIPRDQPLILAGDCHDIPTYHRKHPRKVPTRPRPSRALPLAVSTQPKNGTTLAYRFLTLTTTRGAPLTVAALPFVPLDQTAPKLLEALADAERRLARRPDLLLYDGAAYGTPTLLALESTRIPFLVRAPQNRRLAALCRQHAGLLCFVLPDFPVRATPDRVDDPQARVTLVAVSRRLLDEARIDVPHTEQSTKWFLYATNLRPRPGESDRQFALRIALLYKERWQVETGYRGIEELRGFTHTLRYDVRLLQFFLAVVLANLWALQRQRTGEAWTKTEVALFLFAALLWEAVDERNMARDELEVSTRPLDPMMALDGGHQET